MYRVWCMWWFGSPNITTGQWRKNTMAIPTQCIYMIWLSFWLISHHSQDLDHALLRHHHSLHHAWTSAHVKKRQSWGTGSFYDRSERAGLIPDWFPGSPGPIWYTSGVFTIFWKVHCSQCEEGRHFFVDLKLIRMMSRVDFCHYYYSQTLWWRNHHQGIHICVYISGVLFYFSWFVCWYSLK